MRLPALIMGVLMGTNLLIAQDYKKASTTEGSNYYDVVAKQRVEFAKEKRTNQSSLSAKKERKHFERWAYYWKDRVHTDGSFPNRLEGWYNAGIVDENGKLIPQSNARTVAKSIEWTNVGPQKVPDANEYPNPPQMGRLNALEWFEDDKGNEVYLVGAPSGGIWKSIDEGETWSPKLDQLAGIGVTDIKISSRTSKKGVIYVSTGDFDATDMNSLGVYKSTDMGETYTATGLTFSLDKQERTSNLLVVNDTIVFVGTKDNVQKTTDGGKTWKKILTSADIGFQDLIFGRLTRHNTTVICADIYGGVYISTDDGDTWGIVVDGGDEEDRVATTVDKSTGLFYFQHTTGEIRTYNPTTAELVSLGKVPDYDAQGGYNQTLLVKNGLIISGGVNGRTSSDNGKTWYNSLNGYWEDNDSDGIYIHPDHHTMGDLEDDESPFFFYSCHDGGLDFFQFDSKTDQKPDALYSSGGVLVTQIYTVAITPQNADYFLIGNQDNDGYSKEIHKGKVQWIAAAAGDGICTAIDYSDANIRYLGSQNGGLTRTTKGFSGNLYGTDEDQLKTPDGADFVWPLKLHSTTPTTLFGGFGDVYKSTDKAETWTNLNSGVGTVSVIETYGDNIFAIGEDAAKKTTDGGTTWTVLTQPNSEQFMNSITFNQKDPMIVYATIGSYEDGKKVYKSTDGGKTWTNISTGLPNIVMKTITLYQNQTDEVLFVGTELGIYYKKNTDDWKRLGGTDFPNVIVNDLDINYTTNTLVTATYGRGLWQRSLEDLVPTENTNTNTTEVANVVGLVVKTNPVTNGQITVVINDNGTYEYDLYNVIGGIASSGKLGNNNTTIDVSSIVNGVYILRAVDAEGKVTTQKVVVKN